LLLAEISAISHLLAKKAQVCLTLLFDPFNDRARESLSENRQDLLVRRDWELLWGNPQQLAINPVSVAAIGLRVEIGGLLLGAPGQQFAKGSGSSNAFHMFLSVWLNLCTIIEQKASKTRGSWSKRLQ